MYRDPLAGPMTSIVGWSLALVTQDPSSGHAFQPPQLRLVDLWSADFTKIAPE